MKVVIEWKGFQHERYTDVPIPRLGEKVAVRDSFNQLFFPAVTEIKYDLSAKIVYVTVQ